MRARSEALVRRMLPSSSGLSEGFEQMAVQSSTGPPQH
jgi:hypothetical protein